MRARIHDLETDTDIIAESVKLGDVWYWYDSAEDRYLFKVGEINPLMPVVRIIEEKRKE